MSEVNQARCAINRGLWLLLLTCTAVIQPCLAKPFEFGLPVNMRGGLTGARNVVAIGDVNHDGRDDIAVSQQDATVWVHLQSATGSLQAPQAYRLQVASVRTLKILDVDRDGFGELLVGHPDGLVVYDSSRGWRYVPAIGECEQLATGDIDLDGWPDIACAGGDGITSLYFNDRQGAFRPPVSMWTPAAYGSGQVQLKDVTGDGYPDLILIAGGAAGFYIHPNDGDNGFFPAYGYPNAGRRFWPGGVLALDVDADGVDEIITTSSCNTPCAALHVYHRDALGFFRHTEDIPTLDIPVSPIAYDIDRDGHLDLLVLHRGWSAVSRFMGSAGGLSRQAVRSSVPTTWGTPSNFALGDINGDACTDLVVGNSSGMSLLYGKCLSDVTNDFDGDFRSDVFWRNVATGQNLIWRSGDAGRVQSVTGVTSAAWRVVGHGDFDRDGRSDILWRNATTGANAIWKSGSYATQQSIMGVTDVRWRVAGIGDFNGDGQSDILWRHATTGANAIWKSGSYTAQQPIMGVTDVRWQVAGVGDFDGDGCSDILWRHATTGANAIWRSGNYAAQQPIAAMADIGWQVAGVGDFNGFGWSSILWRHTGNGENVIWTKADSEYPDPLVTVANLAWRVAAVGDYDGDGISDLFWRDTMTGANAIWKSANFEAQIRVEPQVSPAWTTPGQ